MDQGVWVPMGCVEMFGGDLTLGPPEKVAKSPLGLASESDSQTLETAVWREKEKTGAVCRCPSFPTARYTPELKLSGESDAYISHPI